ncbi:hypothetical protein SprV_0301186500 [Sparganum proliferum]
MRLKSQLTKVASSGTRRTQSPRWISSVSHIHLHNLQVVCAGTTSSSEEQLDDVLWSEVLRGLDFVYANSDDLLVASSDATEHEVHLRQLFERLNSFNVVIDAVRCEFGVPSLVFVGPEVNSDGIKAIPEKVSAISTFPVSTIINQLRRLLAMVNYYHRFLPRGATILQPLNSLLAYSKKTLVMTEDAVKSFNDVKAALASATLLAHPAQMPL